MLDRLNAYLDAHRDRFIEEWMALLRFATVAAEPARAPDCRECASWLANHLDAIGLEARVLETSAAPVVYAGHAEQPGRPTVLLYGHYDVQPVDPLEAWDSPPFEPEIRDGRLYARGAEDNKGQFFSALKAVEALRALGTLPVNVKVLIEGNEESGSGGVFGQLDAWRPMLRADVLMVMDTGTAPDGTPAIVMGLRGLLCLAVTLTGSAHDLHSGMHGGVAPNPATGMACLLATLFGDDGRVAVDGFYDGVLDPTPVEQTHIGSDPFDAEAYRKSTGVPPLGGEQAYAPAVRLGFRPALDVNGIAAGNVESIKTIIPASATARLTARLAAGQDPEACLESICGHLRRHTPPGLALGFHDLYAIAPGFRTDPDHRLIALAAGVLQELSGRKPVLQWEGASIPVIPALAATGGAEPLLVGFGREDDRVHAPNESFSLQQFETGFRYTARMLDVLGQSESI